MKVVLIYIRVIQKIDPNFVVPKDYEASSKRFLETYKRFRPKIDHDLVIVNCGSDSCDSLFDEVAIRYETDMEAWFDCGTWQHIGGRQECDLVVCLNTHCYFWREGWLEPFVRDFKAFGKGVYGPTASYEQHPHLRTPCIAFSPEVMRKYPHQCLNRLDAGSFEFGPDNFSLWAHRNKYPVVMVTDKRPYNIKNWRTARNGFRNGDQSNCLVLDRHTEIYSQANAADKRMLEKAANHNIR